MSGSSDMIETLILYSDNRCESTLGTLRVCGPARHVGLRVIEGVVGGRIDPQKVSQGDMVLLQRDFPRHGKAYQEIVALARRMATPVFFDLDDLLLELPEEHPDRLSHHYSQALLPMLRAIIEADAVTASTRALCEYLRPFNPNVYLLPNYLDDELWHMRQPRSPREPSQPVVIGYMGGDSHAPDLRSISPALANIARRFGDEVKFHFLGSRPPHDLVDFPQVSWEPSTTFAYRQFAQEFLGVDYDICIAPLKDNLFNRCKSAIKYLEYTALGAPGVYSRVRPYAEVVDHGRNGYLASTPEEWEEYLCELIESPELRFEIAARAQEEVQANWLLSDHADQWPEVYAQAASQDASRREAGGVPPKVISSLAEQIQDYQRDLQSQIDSHQTRLEQLADQKRGLENDINRLNKIEWERDQFSRRLWLFENRRHGDILDSIRQTADRIARLPGDSRRTARRGFEKIKGWLAGSQASGGESRAERLTSLEIPSQGNRCPSKLDILLFAVVDWETRIRRPQHLAKQFADQGHRVFYVQSSLSTQRDPEFQPVYPNIHTAYLPSSKPLNPTHDSMEEPALGAFYRAVADLRIVCDIANDSAACLVNQPFWSPLALRLRRDFGWKLIYDCIDDHEDLTHPTEQEMIREKALTEQSDLVFVTSHASLKKKLAHNPNCLLAPNGVDFDHFSLPTLDRPQAIKPLNTPIIGYHGEMDNRFDSQLVADLANARPGWDFVLIGPPLDADLTPLQGLHNIFIIGEVSYRQLPAYLQSFNVAMIPYQENSPSQTADHSRLFEYLSAGKAVVAADSAELGRYREHIRLVSGLDEWILSIEEALQEDSISRVQARQEFARRNGWAHRYQQMATSIKSLYPKASIVILTYNNMDYNRLCLESICTKTGYPHFEVIIVDNASTDGTPEFLESFAREHGNIQLILNQTNAGFARGNNQGAMAASGDFLIFMNNDTVVTHGWLSGLIRHLQDLDVGMVGPVTNWSGNESRIEVDYLTLQELDDFARNYSAHHAGQRFEIKMLPFMCVAMRSSVFEEIGPLDETFGLGMFEDDDYALRLKSRGYKIICAEDVFIHHWGSASFSRLEQKKYQRLFEENRLKFEAKWGISWEKHRERD